MTSPNPALVSDVEMRRTFAIISHPDAGKTTLTEKLLLFGGAIQMDRYLSSASIPSNSSAI